MLKINDEDNSENNKTAKITDKPARIIIATFDQIFIYTNL